MKKYLAILILAIISLMSFQINVKQKVESKKMNVLFIPVDDLNHWIGYFGRNNQVKTPNMDRLSAMGLSFTNAYCAAPVCCPSRAALMSGLRPSTSGVYDNDDDWRKAIPKEITLPSFFKKNGYAVLGGGKIYHVEYDREEEYDYYFHSPTNNPNKNITKKGNFGGIKWAQLDAEDDALADFHVAKWVASELLKKHDKPLFLAAGLFKPHLPWHVPKKYFDLYPIDKIVLPPYKEDDLEDLPEEGKKMSKNTHAQIQSETQWREAIQAYQATISYADAQIGIILDAYEKSPEKENTMIVLWGDHGWHLGEKHHWRKFALWEEATRSPLIWVVPKLTKPGSKCSKTVDFMSIYPTLAELNGLKTPTHVEGKSIKKLLANPNAEWNIPALTTYKEGNHAVRSENYRYIRYAKGGEEFYDEKNDPFEWVNIINDKNILAQKKELSKLMPKTEKKGVGNNGGKAEE